MLRYSSVMDLDACLVDGRASRETIKNIKDAKKELDELIMAMSMRV